MFEDAMEDEVNAIRRNGTPHIGTPHITKARDMGISRQTLPLLEYHVSL